MDIDKDAEALANGVRQATSNLHELELTGEAGEGKVRVSLNGFYEVVGIRIDPSLLSPDKRAEVERLVSLAFNEAVAATSVELAARVEALASLAQS